VLLSVCFCECERACGIWIRAVFHRDHETEFVSLNRTPVIGWLKRRYFLRSTRRYDGAGWAIRNSQPTTTSTTSNASPHHLAFNLKYCVVVNHIFWLLISLNSAIMILQWLLKSSDFTEMSHNTRHSGSSIFFALFAEMQMHQSNN
jgi:hypothetical protein